MAISTTSPRLDMAARRFRDVTSPAARLPSTTVTVFSQGRKGRSGRGGAVLPVVELGSTRGTRPVRVSRGVLFDVMRWRSRTARLRPPWARARVRSHNPAEAGIRWRMTTSCVGARKTPGWSERDSIMKSDSLKSNAQFRMSDFCILESTRTVGCWADEEAL